MGSAGIDRHAGKHLWFEQAVLIVDCRADQKPAGRWVDCGRNVVDTRFEDFVWQREQGEANLLADRYPGRFRLPHKGRQPHRREIADDKYGIAGAAADKLARSDLALYDRAGDRRRDRGVGTHLPCFLKCLDLLFRTAKNSQPVVGGFQRGLRRAQVILRRRQIVLCLLPVLERHRLAGVEIVRPLFDNLRKIKLGACAVQSTQCRDEIIQSLHRVGGFDDEQRLTALNLVARFHQKLCHAARIGREDRRRAFFVDGDFAFGQMLGAKDPFRYWLDCQTRPLRRSWNVARQFGFGQACRFSRLRVLDKHPRGAKDAQANQSRRRESDSQPSQIPISAGCHVGNVHINVRDLARLDETADYLAVFAAL